MLPEELQNELDGILGSHNWLRNFNLSPYTTLLCGRVIKWIEEGPADPKKPVLHIASPAGENVADILAVVLCAYATREAWLNELDSELRAIEANTKIRLQIENKKIDVYFKSYNRPNLNAPRVVVARTNQDTNETWELPIAPVMFRQSPVAADIANRIGIERFQGHAQTHFRKTRLDRLLSMQGTRGLCKEERRRHVLLGTSNKGVFNATAQNLNFEGEHLYKLLELQPSGVETFSKRFDNCLPAAGINLREKINNELWPLLEQCGIDRGSLTPLEGVTNAGLDAWLEQAEALAQEQGEECLEAVQEVTTDLKEALKGQSDDLFDPDRTLVIVCKGYDLLLDPGNGFECLVKQGARIVVVGDPFRFTCEANYREERLPNWFVERVQRFDTRATDYGVANEPPAPMQFQDHELLKTAHQSVIPVVMRTLSGEGPGHALYAVWGDLFGVLSDLGHAPGIRKLILGHLFPVIRVLSTLPHGAAGETRQWLDGKIARAMELIGEIQLEQVTETLHQCIRTIQAVMDAMADPQVSKRDELDLENEWLYYDYETGDDGSGVRWWVSGSGALPKEEGVDERPQVAITGWNGRHAAHWLHKQLRDAAVRQVKLVGYERDNRLWHGALDRMHTINGPNAWKEILDQVGEIWRPLNIEEGRIPVPIQERVEHTPHYAVEPDEPAEEILKKERDQIRIQPQGGGAGPHTVEAAYCLQFDDGTRLRYPTKGKLKFFAVHKGKIIEKPPSELETGERLVWVEEMNALIRERVLAGLPQALGERLYQWREALVTKLDEGYDRDRGAMSSAMEQFGISNARMNLNRWLDGDVYAPQNLYLDPILRFCDSELAEDEDSRHSLMLEIRRASYQARKNRPIVKEALLGELNQDELLHTLLEAETGVPQQVMLFNAERQVTVLRLEDRWLAEGPFSQEDMYTLNEA